ncbi:hypothetical protein BDQ17DRAFT_1233971, partial [Cyathus striatus]
EDGSNPGNNLHVPGLSHETDAYELKATFTKIARVKTALVVHDSHTCESSGFAFVTMEASKEADAAITAFNTTEILRKVVIEKVALILRFLERLLIDSLLFYVGVRVK